MKAFYAGGWQSGEALTKVINPYTEEVIDTVPRLGPEVLDQVLPALNRGARLMAGMGRESLQEVSQSLYKIIRGRRDELALLVVLEQGKPIREAGAEVDSALASLKIISLNASLSGMEILPISKEADFGNRYGFTIRQAHGVVAILTPSPHPFLLPVVGVAFALAAGNAVLLKPSSHTPLIALALVEMLLEAGCPPEALACLTGSGDKLGRAICARPDIHHIVCQGRLPTILDIRKRASFVPTQLQWSCVSSCVIMKTGPVDVAVDLILKAALTNAGQSAFSPTWVAVHESRHEEVRECFRTKIESLEFGNPVDSATQIGAVTTAATARRLRKRVAFEVSNGAELVCGHAFDEGIHPRRIAPILLDQCNLKSTLCCRRELSGPLIGITPVAKARKATRQIANQRFHVLTFFTADEDWAVREAMRLSFDNIHVNGIPSWSDGLICLPGNPSRAGRATAESRVHEMSHIRDVICHERETRGGV